MRSSSPVLVLALGLLALGAAPAAAAPRPSAAIVAAVADPSRPAEDAARDANRKPAETLAFVGLKPGDRVADYIANSGYFTRLFSDVVGPRGRVFAVELNEIVTYANVAKGYAALQAWAPGRPNVTLTTVPASEPVAFPEKLDAFWISQNYHDLHDKFLGPVDVAAFNRQVFAALKPGGHYIVLDHSAVPGAPADVTETLHRIEADTVKREVEAAGFVLEAESDLLANPADPRTKGVFDDSIRGHTDQFMLKFRKPRG
ncbi:MAG TPA: methyltransferase [Phenylobacterium sp.]|nr:methyltransferase [Phenylobacterium sp.]